MDGEKKKSINEILRSLPSIDSLTLEPWFMELMSEHSRGLVIGGARKVMDEIRVSAIQGKIRFSPDSSEIKNLIREACYRMAKGNLLKIINGTGVVLHTNLGRAPLCTEAIRRIEEVSVGYSNLEFNTRTGERGSRHSVVEPLLCHLTGAEGAMVVNNNAAAVTLILSELAKEKEVIVSRGQLVEIGGSFRIPDVMAESGAFLKEVGSTNKTHLTDYEKAISENTVAVMKIHTSNYRIFGFTKEVDTKELVELAKSKGIYAIEDLGSGSLIDLSTYGLPYEPTVQEAVSMGMDLVSFSGDKLLGGPQAGIIVGKKSLIERIKRHPLARAFRMDKLTLAALEGTLLEYIDEARAIEKIPVLHMLTMSYDEVKKKGMAFLGQLKENPIEKMEVHCFDAESEVGGGSLPTHLMKTFVISVKKEGYTPDSLAARLRNGETGIVGRIFRDEYILDMRTIAEDEFSVVIDELRKL